MVESPQRIWIEADDECPYFYEAHELHDVEQDVIEYVRADLYAALEAQLAEARQAVALFEDYGCPVCHGDCASANPPVYCCPMQIARRVREGGAR